MSLSSKLLFNGAKLLTVRTLSFDGNSESKDSPPIKLSKSLMGLSNQPNVSKVNENITESPKKKPEPQSSTGLFGQTGSLLQNFSNEINSLKANTKNALNEIKPTLGPVQPQQPLQTQPNQAPVQSQPAQQPSTMTKKISNPMIKNMPLVSDISRKKPGDTKPPPQNKSGIDTDADLYENFRSDPAPKQPAKPQKTIQNPYNSPNLMGTPPKKVTNEQKDVVIKSISKLCLFFEFKYYFNHSCILLRVEFSKKSLINLNFY